MKRKKNTKPKNTELGFMRDGCICVLYCGVQSIKQLCVCEFVYMGCVCGLFLLAGCVDFITPLFN